MTDGLQLEGPISASRRYGKTGRCGCQDALPSRSDHLGEGNCGRYSHSPWDVASAWLPHDHGRDHDLLDLGESRLRQRAFDVGEGRGKRDEISGSPSDDRRGNASWLDDDPGCTSSSDETCHRGRTARLALTLLELYQEVSILTHHFLCRRVLHLLNKGENHVSGLGGASCGRLRSVCILLSFGFAFALLA